MKVSIAMATYNGAQYLQEQLNSFKDQTRLPDELIITDDCSTDETEQIISEFAKTAPFKVIFSRNEKNLGYCGNFNAALMKTSGDLVFLSDQDDVWFPEKIEYMVALSNKNPKYLILMNNSELTDGYLTTTGLNSIEQFKSVGLDTSYFTMGCCSAVRRELINICLPIPSGFKAHDDWLSAFANGLNAKLVDHKILQYYRRHEANESQFIANRTTRVSRFDVYLDVLKGLRDRNSYNNKINHNIDQMSILSNSIKKSINIAPDHWKKDLINLDVEVNLNIYTAKQRSAIRNKVLPNRMLSAVYFFNKGLYRNSNGVSSMMRDIIG